jgi:hypothetical protein
MKKGPGLGLRLERETLYLIPMGYDLGYSHIVPMLLSEIRAECQYFARRREL